MRISRVKIQNFRSLQNVDVAVSDDYTTLIGKNDCGKSSFLKALEYLFDPETRIGVTDVCGFMEEGEESFIQATISDCWHPDSKDGVLTVRRVFDAGGYDRLQREGPVPRLQILKDMSQGVGTRKRLDEDQSMEAGTKEYAQMAIREICASGTVPAHDWVRLYDRINGHSSIEFETGWHHFADDELKRLVKVIFLAADVRGEEEISTGGRSIFDKIGQFILGSTEDSFPAVVEARDKLTEELGKIVAKNDDGKWQVERLNEFDQILKEEIERYDANVATETMIQAPRLSELNFSLDLLVRDSWVGSVAQMGHGMRRSLVFAMLRANRRLLESVQVAAPVNQRPLFLFLIEEPEIYLHPQAERPRMSQLKALAGDANAQVVLCTHSAIFVDLGQYKGILRLERPTRRETSISSWQGNDLPVNDRKTLSLIHRFDPGKSAMLFADLVILVEGQCESDAIPFLAESLGVTDVNTDVEVIDCHGNQDIPVFQKVLESFGIKYVAWPDSDVQSVVTMIQGIRTAAYGKIVITDHDWETMNGLAPGGNRKVYNSWMHFIYNGNPPNGDLETRIRAAYSWNDYP